MVKSLLVFGFLLALGAACDGAAPLVLNTRSARVGNAPLMVRFATSLERNPKNRNLCLQWDSKFEGGRGCVQIDGEEAPLTFWRDVTFRSGGDYNVVAYVLRSDGSISYSSVQLIHVLSLGQE